MEFRMRARFGWLLVGLMLLGCVAEPPQPKNVYQGLQSEDPAVRAESVLKAGNERIVKAVPLLIDRLSDNAPEVRMLANLALQKITGQDFGFRPWDPPAQRHEAIERWRGWWLQEHPVTGRSPLAAPVSQPATNPSPASQPMDATDPSNSETQPA